MEQAASELARALSALRRKERKICARCGKEFEGLARARYCGRECANSAYWESNRPKLNARRRERYQNEKARAEG